MNTKIILGIIIALVIVFWLVGIAMKIVSAMFHLAFGAIVVLALIIWWITRKTRSTPP